MGRKLIAVFTGAFAAGFAGAAVLSMPAQAGSMDTPITYKWTANKDRFAQRIKFIGEQIELGQSKGWLTADQVSKFKEDYNRINSAEQSWQGQGCPEAGREPLEKDVTAVHHYLHEAINATYARTSAEPAAKKTAKTPRAGKKTAGQ